MQASSLLDSPVGKQLPQMRTVCTLRANLAKLGAALSQRTGKPGYRYWLVSFEVVLELGRTQLQARLQWKEGVRSFNPFERLSPTDPISRPTSVKVQSLSFQDRCIRCMLAYGDLKALGFGTLKEKLSGRMVSEIQWMFM